MKKEMNKYWLLKSHGNHPEGEALTGRFSFVNSRFSNNEQFFIFRYFLRDLIFLSGLFFVPYIAQSVVSEISEPKNNKPLKVVPLGMINR